MSDDEDRWSFSAGPHGYRARVFERTRGGNVYLESWDDEKGRKVKTSQGFPVRDANGELMDEAVEKAEALAAEASNRLIRGQTPHEDEDPPTTLGELFDAFRRETVADLTGQYKKQVLRDLECLERFLGEDLPVETLGPREWNAVRRARASGEIDARGHRVADPDERDERGDRAVAKTLKVLRQACRFGERYRTRDGGYLLGNDPT